MSSRWIIKPIFEHASVGLDDDGVLTIRDRCELTEAMRIRWQRTQRPHFAEGYIEGREFNLSLLADGPGAVEVLPVAEIDFGHFPPGKPRIVGYRAKWVEQSFEYRHTPRRFVDERAEPALDEELKTLAVRCWQLFDLRGYARVDFRVDERGQPWILEVNVNPCLAPDAGFAAAVQQSGSTFVQAIARIVEAAVD